MRKSSSPNDPLPPTLLFKPLNIISPFLVELFNLSFKSSTVPKFFKHASIKPILKKSKKDTNEPSHYRPISLLPFISKVLEKLVASRLDQFIKDNHLDEEFQSGFKSSHSTESALLKVTNDMRRASDNNQLSLLALLDLSSAFDTIDHQILLTRLSSSLGIQGPALAWICSYITDRSQSVHFNGSSSSPKPLLYGVPQGSVLGPLLFRLYMLPLGKIIQSNDFSFHCYADDTQIYINSSPKELNSSINKLQNCYISLANWLSTNFLKLNDQKTEIVLIGPENLRNKIQINSINLGNTNIKLSTGARNSGVYCEESLSFKDHISNV